jgi:hypothetical protein
LASCPLALYRVGFNVSIKYRKTNMPIAEVRRMNVSTPNLFGPKRVYVTISATSAKLPLQRMALAIVETIRLAESEWNSFVNSYFVVHQSSKYSGLEANDCGSRPS